MLKQNGEIANETKNITHLFKYVNSKCVCEWKLMHVNRLNTT
jgi:hypothetical protein